MSDDIELHFDENAVPVAVHRDHLFTADELPASDGEREKLLVHTEEELEAALLRDLEREGWIVIAGPHSFRRSAVSTAPDGLLRKGEVLVRVHAQVEQAAVA